MRALTLNTGKLCIENLLCKGLVISLELCYTESWKEKLSLLGTLEEVRGHMLDI